MNKLTDVTIVGAGPVGLFGAFYAGLRGMSVRIVDSLTEPGGQLTALYPEKFVYDMPGFPEILAKDLADGLLAQANRFHPELALGERCETLEQRDGHWLLRTHTEEHPSKTVIICAGIGAFSPTKIGVDREDHFTGAGLMYGVRSKENLRGKKVIIIGGGDSALDWSLGLEHIAREIVLVHRRDGFRAHEENVRKLRASTVEVRTWEVVTELHGEDQLHGVTVLNKQTHEVTELSCDSLIVNIGFKAALGPLKGWGLEIVKNKIRANSRMETNLLGVYAAGDICTHDAKLDLIATGVGEVCTAVNYAKTFIDPEAEPFPGHSSDMALPALDG
ncbi:MAG: NAD(P)/FAD-dependent oxidoreductase [Fimbriimonadales bacterium]